MDSTVNIEPEQDKPHDLSMKPTNHQNVTENQNYNTVVSQKNPIASGGTSLQTNQNQRKVKKYHIPPPLDLNAHTLEPDHVQGGVLGGGSNHDPSVRVPKSPNELPRESLPLRKR